MFCELIYGFCSLYASDFILFSFNIFNTLGDISKINTKQFSRDIGRYFYSNKVAKTWNEHVVTPNIKHFCDKLDSIKVSEIIENFLKNACWYSIFSIQLSAGL